MRFSIIIALFVSMWVSGFSQEVPPISFDTIKLEDAQRIINSIHGQKGLIDFAAAAVRTRRLDLIELCFRNQYTAGWVRNEIANLPDSAFKDEMTLMMLKTDSPLWPPEWLYPGLRSPNRVILEPFASVAARHLPNISFDGSLLINRGARLQLAEEIETAIAKEKGSLAPLTVGVTTTPSSSPSRPKSTNEPTGNGQKAAPSRSSNSGRSSGHSYSALFGALIVMVFMGGFFLAGRSFGFGKAKH